MARRRRPEKREILPDPVYGDEVLSKFMNSVMLDGKKSVAELIVYGALETVEQRAKREPIGVFHDALNNIKVEFLDRTNQYNPGVVESFDQAAIDRYGRRTDGTRTSHMFADPNAAKLSCTEMVGKSMGKPPASMTPRLTASISCVTLPWQGL